MKRLPFTFVELLFIPILLFNLAWIGVLIWGAIKLVNWITSLPTT